jgi:hypothetical protein
VCVCVCVCVCARVCVCACVYFLPSMGTWVLYECALLVLVVTHALGRGGGMKCGISNYWSFSINVKLHSYTLLVLMSLCHPVFFFVVCLKELKSINNIRLLLCYLCFFL